MPDNPLQPLWKSSAPRWDYFRAAHLLNRAGFGGSSADIEQLVALGPEKAVEHLVRYHSIQNNLPDLEFGELSGPIAGGKEGVGKRAFGEQAQLLRDLTPDQRKALFELRQGAQRLKFEEMKLWWLDRMVRTSRPLEEKLTLFWHGLFVSSNTTVKNTYLLYKQNQLLRRHAAGNYKTLALEISQDPAMLEYLNNNQNKKEHPNENYARELMELFTMGIGNYTETDIKESARAFTGWTALGDQFIFNRREHDDGAKTFLGRTGNFDGQDIINIIFDHPATPLYIARRLATFFGADDPPPEVTSGLAAAVRVSRFELAPVLEVLFSSNWFYSEDVMRRQIKSPVQLVVGSLRALGVNMAQPRAVDNALKMMGQELLNAPTVKGWDGGRAWINTSTLFARYNLPAYLGTGRLPAVGKRPEAADVRTQFNEFNSGWAPQIDLAEAAASTTDAVVDLYIKKLLCDKLAPRKRQDLIEFINATGDDKSHPFDPVAPDAENQIRSFVHLIMAMAEYQLC